MTIKICPRCQTRIVFMPNSGDFVHDCSVGASEALKNEDVVVTGPYEDYTTDGQVAVMQGDVNHAGIANKLWGTRAAIEGHKVHNFTSRGNNADTHRTRTHLQYIEKPDNL